MSEDEYRTIEIKVHPWLWEYVKHNRRTLEIFFNECVQNRMEANWNELVASMKGLKDRMGELAELKKEKIELLKIIGADENE